MQTVYIRGNMKKSILLIIIAVLCGAGVFAYGEHPMDKALQTWIGMRAKEVVKIWGDPSTIEYEQGQTKYIWEETQSRFIPGTQLQKRVDCNRILVVDTSGRVVYAKFTGEGCPFTTESAKKYINPNSKIRK